jgi:hypothetical protein
VAQNPGFLADAKKRSVSLVIMSTPEVQDYVKTDDAVLRELWEKDPWIK